MGVLRIASADGEKEARLLSLMNEVVELIKSNGEAGDQYTKDGFSRQFQGERGPLRAGRHRIHKAIEMALEKGFLNGGKGEVLTVSRLPLP